MSAGAAGAAEDVRHLRAALDLARQGLGRASPNPAVGAVVVAGGEVVGTGFHVFAHRDHAEALALREAGERARGATLYVTLEPCSTHGRTPPCVDAVLAAGIARVVTCIADPNPAHRGAALTRLKAEGVTVDVGLEREEAVGLNAPFCKWVTQGVPLVTLKLATSVDGRLAASSGQSQWLTGEAARGAVHELRSQCDAILCGVGTVLADDPQLTARSAGAVPTRPLLCVIDPRLRTPPGARLLTESGGDVVVFTAAGSGRDARADDLRRAGADIVEIPALPPQDAASGLDLGALSRHLAQERHVTALLVEGGGVTAGRFVAAGLVDRLVVHVAPILLGGLAPLGAFAGLDARTLDEAVHLRDMTMRRLGDDLGLEFRPEGGFDPLAFAAELARLEPGREAV